MCVLLQLLGIEKQHMTLQAHQSNHILFSEYTQKTHKTFFFVIIAVLIALIIKIKLVEKRKIGRREEKTGAQS